MHPYLRQQKKATRKRGDSDRRDFGQTGDKQRSKHNYEQQKHFHIDSHGLEERLALLDLALVDPLLLLRHREHVKLVFGGKLIHEVHEAIAFLGVHHEVIDFLEVDLAA